MYKISKIEWEILYIRYKGCLDFAKNLNVKNCVKSTGNCVHFMYRLSGFTEKMNSADSWNIQNCVNPKGNCVH